MGQFVWVDISNNFALCHWENLYCSLDGLVGGVVGCAEGAGGVVEGKNDTVSLFLDKSQRLLCVNYNSTPICLLFDLLSTSCCLYIEMMKLGKNWSCKSLKLNEI